MLLSVTGLPSSKTVQIRIYNKTTAVEVVAWTATGVSERADGQGYSVYYYDYTLIAGSEYIVDWKDNSTPIKTASETINVLQSGVAQIVAKLPNDNIMGSSVLTAKDDEIDAILEDTGTTLPATLANATYGLSALQVLLDAIDTSTELTAKFTEIKGAGWTTETLAAIDVLIDAIKAKTDSLAFTGSDVKATLDGEEVTPTAASKTGYALSVAGILAIWNQLTTDVGIIASSFAKKFADWAVGTIDTYTGNTKQTGDVFPLASTDIPAIKAKTDTIVWTDITTILARIGAFTGSGWNTILGMLKAMARKDTGVTLPTDIGGTFDNTTDSLEAKGGSIILPALVGAVSGLAMQDVEVKIIRGDNSYKVYFTVGDNDGLGWTGWTPYFAARKNLGDVDYYISPKAGVWTSEALGQGYVTLDAVDTSKNDTYIAEIAAIKGTEKLTPIQFSLVINRNVMNVVDVS